MYVLSSNCQSEIIIKKSIFLAEGFFVETQESTRDLLKKQKQKYKDARHVVHAFVIGKEKSILGSSDDGEPKGTAGRPALLVLQHAPITNIMVTITRWFGGVLLGTGGLVKAYTDSTKALLDVAILKELATEKCLKIICSYNEGDYVKNVLEKNNVIIVNKNYTQNVEYFVKINEENKKALVEYLYNNTRALIEEIN
ncbi:MAG: YigZ family protein [Treponema sp.]